MVKVNWAQAVVWAFKGGEPIPGWNKILKLVEKFGACWTTSDE
jgi:hypothetical protein